MNGTDGIRTQEECLFSDAKRALFPRRSVSLQRFFRKRCAKYHEIRFACVRSCRCTARTSAEDGPTKDGEGRTPSPPYRILCLRTETHADIAHGDGIKAHVCRCMRRIGIATARRPLLEMKVIRVALWLLIVIECIIQAIQSYWWYKYKGITYHLLVKNSILPCIERILLISIAIILLYLFTRWIIGKCYKPK